MSPYESITVESYPRTPRQTECVGDNSDGLDNIEYKDDGMAQTEMTPTEIVQQDILWSWQENTMDLYDRYNFIVDSMTTFNKELFEATQYVKDLKVPYSWECARLTFAKTFNDLSAEFLNIDIQIATFPNELECHMKLAIQRADKSVSEKSIEFLENLLAYYADRVSWMEDELKRLKKNGMQCVVASQQITTVCGDFEF